jgi:hypothetical protein
VVHGETAEEGAGGQFDETHFACVCGCVVVVVWNVLKELSPTELRSENNSTQQPDNKKNQINTTIPPPHRAPSSSLSLDSLRLSSERYQLGTPRCRRPQPEGPEAQPDPSPTSPRWTRLGPSPNAHTDLPDSRRHLSHSPLCIPAGGLEGG